MTIKDLKEGQSATICTVGGDGALRHILLLNQIQTVVHQVEVHQVEVHQVARQEVHQVEAVVVDTAFKNKFPIRMCVHKCIGNFYFFIHT